jgi:hypothetical protein
MPIKLKGLDQVLSNLKITQTEISKVAVSQLRQGAIRIQQSARNYSPVEFGNLESSIKTEEQITDTAATIRIGVDDATPVPERPGKHVGDYALFIHESDYHLGPASLAKAAATGKQVGPKFLERAFTDHQQEITDAVADAVRREIN